MTSRHPQKTINSSHPATDGRAGLVHGADSDNSSGGRHSATQLEVPKSSPRHPVQPTPPSVTDQRNRSTFGAGERHPVQSIRPTRATSDIISYQAKGWKDDEPERAVHVFVDDLQAEAHLDSKSGSNFISEEFCDSLRKKPRLPPPGCTREFQGATGEKMVLVGMVWLRVYWEVREQYVSAQLSFNVAKGLVYDMVITEQEGERTGMVKALKVLPHSELRKGTVAPIKPTSSVKMPKQSKPLTPEQLAKLQKAKEIAAQEEAERRHARK
jgi:hypothetical protein